MAVHLVGAAGMKYDGIDKRIAKADIDQPGFVELDLEQHVIELRAEAAILAPHPRRKHGDAKAQRPQQLAKQPIQFVAEAAAMADDDFVVGALDVQNDGHTERNVEVLESDGE